MFIVLLDEPTLFVFQSEEEVRRDIEPPDAEVEIRAIFDEKAIPYRVEWIRPNIHRKGLFGLGSVTFGEYSLVPCGEADPSGLMRLLQEHCEWGDPPSFKEPLSNLLKELRQQFPKHALEIMNITEAQAAFSGLSKEKQLGVLATFGHNLTIAAREAYEFQQPGVRHPENLRAINEIQHRVLGHIRALLSDTSSRYPDDVLVSILLGDYGDEHVRSQVIWSFEDALQRETK